MLPEKLQKARYKAYGNWPFLAQVLWALVPVERPGLGSLAMDQYWRLYYDPQAVERWTVEELMGVLYHEASHLLRNHPERGKGKDPLLVNLAFDAEINDDLLAEKVVLPEGAITPARLGLPAELLGEEYYELLLKRAQQGEGGKEKPKKGQKGEKGASGDQGNGEASSQGQAPQEGGEGGQAQASGEAQGKGKEKGASAGERGKEISGGGGMAFPDRPRPGAGRCGSCAHGGREPWEFPSPEESGVHGVSEAEAEVIRRQVAEAIQREVAEKGRGAVPGHWQHWAEARLRPKVNWRRELAAAVRYAIAETSGAADYTYRRPSRRQGAVKGVILPALRQPVPEVAVVVDTSGSMGDETLAQALAEVRGVLRALGVSQGVHVLAVDSRVQAVKRVFRPEEVKLLGGGGTDMGAGIEAALRLKPRPEVMVVLTDGETPWPEVPPPGVRVVVGLLGDGKAPGWAQTVRIGEEAYDP